MATLHACLESIIRDPSDNGLYEGVDAACYQIWEYCLIHGTNPWGWCFDRYCSCKVALSEHEPDTLIRPISDHEAPWAQVLGDGPGWVTWDDQEPS